MPPRKTASEVVAEAFDVENGVTLIAEDPTTEEAGSPREAPFYFAPDGSKVYGPDPLEGVFIPEIGGEFLELLADSKRVVKGWRPLEGISTAIAGRVVSTEWMSFVFKDDQTGEDKTSTAPATVLKTSDRQDAPLVRVVWLGMVLRSAWDRHNPQRDDIVALRQLGKATSQTGMEYQDWNVLVEKAPGNLTGAQLKQAEPKPVPSTDPNGDPFDDF